MKCHPRSPNLGFAMLLVMIYISLAVAVVAVVSTAVMSAYRMTGTFDASRKAMEAAEYGVAQALANLGEGREANVGLADWRKLHGQAAPRPGAPRLIPAFGEPGVAPLTLAALPGVEYIALAETVERGANGAGGNEPVNALEKQDLVVVYATGRCGNAERRVEAVYRPTLADQDVQPKRFAQIAWRELPPSP